MFEVVIETNFLYWFIKALQKRAITQKSLGWAGPPKEK